MIDDFIIAVEADEDWSFRPGVLDALVDQRGGVWAGDLALGSGGAIQSVRLPGQPDPIAVELAADGSWLSISGEAAQCVDVALWVRRQTPARVQLNFFDSGYSFGHVPVMPETTAAEVLAAIDAAP